VTAVGPAHLDGLGSVDGVAHEKARLLAHVRPGGVAVFHAPCLAYRAFRDIEVQALIATAASGAGAGLPCAARIVPFAIRHEGASTSVCLTWAGSPEEFELRRTTSGMAGNAVLALAVALHLGIEPDALRRRLPRWRPAALRGEVRREAGRTIYLDCYNANPASMNDALEGFLAAAPAGEPRLFVVGCMEELGAESAALHRTVGAQWPLRAGDWLVVFGTQAAELAAGARAVAPEADIRINPDRAEVMRLLEAFHGAVFIKGSRRYALESLLGDAVGAHSPAKEVAA
jgi:UDP-N-acetylmuramoyl-tripeptide--D-alanyl-D-alanine ligase